MQQHLFDVLSINEDFALRDVVVARYEIDQCAFSRSRLSHDGDGLAFLDGHVDIMKYFPCTVITERHMLQFDAQVKSVDADGVLHFLDVVLCVENLVDALHGCHALGYVVAGL